jgi:hypothetical protein
MLELSGDEGQEGLDSRLAIKEGMNDMLKTLESLSQGRYRCRS